MMMGDPAIKIIVEKTAMRVVWRKATEQGLKEVGKQVAKKYFVGTVLKRAAIVTIALDIFTSGSMAPQDVATMYNSYIKDYSGGYEDFWEMWVGPGRAFPLPPTEMGDALNQWLVDYWPEGRELDLSKVQSHHVIPNALLRGSKPNNCLTSTFGNKMNEYDEIWNRIDLPTTIHNGYHSEYNKYMKKNFEDFLSDIKDIVKCGTPDMESEIKKYAEKMREELLKNIKNNPGRKINEIYREINQRLGIY